MKGLGIFIRSFFIQSLWNFRKMQNTGFYYSIFPYFSKKFKDEKDFQRFAQHHLSFFNTHPYMASGIAGVIAHMEEREMSEEDVRAVKHYTSGVCAAIGDTFFWGSLRPFLILCFMVITYVFSNSMVTVFSVILFLSIYNIAHLYVRYGFFRAGFISGVEGIEFINRLKLILVSEKLDVGIFLLSLLFFLLIMTKGAVPYKIPFYVLLLFGGVILTRKISIALLVYGAFVIVTIFHIKGIW